MCLSTICSPFWAFVKELFSAPSILLGTGFYLFDTMSDLILGLRHIREDHHSWGALTLLFFVAPIFFSFCQSLIKEDQRRPFDAKHNIGWCFALFALNPAVNQLMARKYSTKSATPNFDKWSTYTQYSSLLYLNEMLWEAIPQFVLQLYIVIAENRISLLAFISIFFSCVSITKTALGSSVFSVIFRDYKMPRLTTRFRVRSFGIVNY